MLMELSTDLMDPRPDARAITQQDVQMLASSINVVGLIQPIVARPKGDGRYEVIAGMHRLMAVRSLGWETIAALVAEVDDLDAETTMIDENVIRREPTFVERAIYLARRKKLYDLQHRPEREAGRRPRYKGIERFEVAVSKATGIGISTVQQSIASATDILPEVLEMIKGTVLDRANYLRDLRLLPPNEQFSAAQRDLAHAKRVSGKDKKDGVVATTHQQAAARAAAIIAKHISGKDLKELRVALIGSKSAFSVASALDALETGPAD